MSGTILTKELVHAITSGVIKRSDDHGSATIPGVDHNLVPQFIFELLQEVSHGSITVPQSIEALFAAGINSAEQALVDGIWFLWLHLESEESEEASRNLIVEIAQELLTAGLVSRESLMQGCESDFLEWCGLVVSKDGWRRKEVRANTVNIYTQRKYNLLKEDSEGYAKLATLLNQRGTGVLNMERVAFVETQITALIGSFSLDPNRAFSVILDAFVCQPDNESFLSIARLFSKEAVNQLLGFHFAENEQTPQGLYTAAARLMQAGIVQLEALYAHLQPSDDQFTKSFTDAQEAMKQAVSKIGAVSLTTVSNEAQPAYQPKAGLAASALQLDALSYAEQLTHDLGKNNQKLGLLGAALRVRDEASSDELLRLLRLCGVQDPAIFPQVGKALCYLIGHELANEPYVSLCASKARGAILASPIKRQGGDLSSFKLSTRLLDLLKLVGHHMYHDVATLTRLSRVLAVAATTRTYRTELQHILSRNILPAVSLVPSNAALVLEVWKVISQLHYTQRFCLYADLREDSGDSLLLTAAFRLAELEVRRILRRVTSSSNRKEAKAQMRPLGRLLAKICHAAPLAVSEQLLRQVMGLPGMVNSIIEALGLVTPYTFDVMIFSILRTLASPRRKLKEDGLNLEEWFQFLSLFIGVLIKRYSDIEVNALLQYLANQLKESESLDLLVLKEMITTMTGIQSIFDISEPQMDALAGSRTLQIEAIAPPQGEDRFSDKSLQRGSMRLLDSLRCGAPEQQLMLPLLILLAQQRKLIALQPPSPHLKLTSELLDKCHETTLQYISFLQHALQADEYMALLPPIERLANEYSIDPEIVFELYRPLLRTVCPPEIQSVDEEGEIQEEMLESKITLVENEQEDGEVAEKGADVTAGGHSIKSLHQWEEVTKQIAFLSPSGGFSALSSTLYATFWSFTLYDIEVPLARYEGTVSQLKASMRVATEDIQSAGREIRGERMGGHGSFRGQGGASIHNVDVGLLQREIDRCEELLTKLPIELKEQQVNAARVEQQLERTKLIWATDEGPAARQILAKEFVQHCVLPRVFNSPADALYCARFLKRAHRLGVPRFPLLTIIDKQMRDFGFLVRCITPREATNLGIFLHELLGMVEQWRSPEVFARECASSPAFMLYKSDAQELQPTKHEEFLKISTNWQKVLTTDVFIACVSSQDYMQIKNALLVLNRMVKIFPGVAVYADMLRKAVEPVRENDPREDLKTLARMYCTALAASVKDKGRVLAATPEEYAGLKRHLPSPTGVKAQQTSGQLKQELPPGFAPKVSAADSSIDTHKAPNEGDKGKSSGLRAEARAFVPKRSAPTIATSRQTSSKRKRDAEASERPSVNVVKDNGDRTKSADKYGSPTRQTRDTDRPKEKRESKQRRRSRDSQSPEGETKSETKRMRFSESKGEVKSRSHKSLSLKDPDNVKEGKIQGNDRGGQDKGGRTKDKGKKRR